MSTPTPEQIANVVEAARSQAWAYDLVRRDVIVALADRVATLERESAEAARLLTDAESRYGNSSWAKERRAWLERHEGSMTRDAATKGAPKLR